MLLCCRLYFHFDVSFLCLFSLCLSSLRFSLPSLILPLSLTSLLLLQSSLLLPLFLFLTPPRRDFLLLSLLSCVSDCFYFMGVKGLSLSLSLSRSFSQVYEYKTQNLCVDKETEKEIGEKVVNMNACEVAIVYIENKRWC